MTSHIHKYIVLSNFFQNNTFIIAVGLFAGVLSALSMLPQVLKTLKEKKAEDVSPVMLIVLITGLAFWTFYGVLKHDLPLILTNGFSFMLNLLMLFLRWKYRNK